MVIEQITSENESEWNAVAPHPMQSWQWGQVRQEHGVDLVRFAVFNGPKIVQVFQMTFHKIPFTPYTIGYLPRSSLFDTEVLQFIQQLAMEKKAIFVKCEPYEEKNSQNDMQIDRLLQTRSIRKSPHGLFPNWTQVIDLQKTEEQLFALLKQKTRYNIKLAQKKGVSVTEETNDGGFAQFITLYFETCRRQGYHGHTKQYHKTLYKLLNKSIAHILIAAYEGIPLSAYELFLFNGILYYPYGGSSVIHRNLMASNLLMWEAIRFGIKHKAKKFDLWGSLPPDSLDSRDTWAGFSRFKEGYGTKYVEFVGSYDIIMDPALYHLYNTAYILRKLFLKVF